MEEVVYWVGTDPNGYGGEDEVSAEQARAYGEAVATQLRVAFPAVKVEIGRAPTLVLSREQLAPHGWVQRNWRRIRAEVNAARGWSEQVGGADQPGMERCF